MRIYLDNSASTPLLPEVLDAMRPWFTEEYGNAQSVHSFGQRAKAAVETARRQVARLVRAHPAEIVFTSGGTESDNFAVRGIAGAHASGGRHIITTEIEHPAVLGVCEALEREGLEVQRVRASGAGVVDPEDISRAIRPDTILVSVMHANNETGAIQPVAEIGSIVRERRLKDSPHLHFHSDAVQSAGKIRVDVGELGVDLLSLSAHKIHGPKGVGALFVRKGVRLDRLLHGGRHERDRRAGSENVPGIVGFGLAAELAESGLEEHRQRMGRLRDLFEESLAGRLTGVAFNCRAVPRLPNISSVSIQGVDGEALMIALDLKGVAVSTGAACASGSLRPSHVLLALGLADEEVRGSLRISLSRLNTEEEGLMAVGLIEDAVKLQRKMSAEIETVSSGLDT